MGPASQRYLVAKKNFDSALCQSAQSLTLHSVGVGANPSCVTHWEYIRKKQIYLQNHLILINVIGGFDSGKKFRDTTPLMFKNAKCKLIVYQRYFALITNFKLVCLASCQLPYPVVYIIVPIAACSLQSIALDG